MVVVAFLASFLEVTPAHSAGPVLADHWHFAFAGEDTSASFATLPLSDTSWKPVTVPHTFNPPDEFAAHKTGIGWYSRDVGIPKDTAGRELFLRFEGVCLRAVVYVDGVRAGVNNLAYLPFEVNITRYAAAKDTLRVAVAIDSRVRNHHIPDKKCNGWWLFGGLIGEVKLVARAVNRLKHVAVRTFHAGGDTFDLDLSFEAPGVLPDSVRLRIERSEGEAMLCSTLTAHAAEQHHSIRCTGVRAWSPRDPYLYRFSVTPFFEGAPGEPVTFQRGFRSLTTGNTGFFLNGRRIVLRGIGRHDVRAGKGPFLNRRERLQDLVDIKRLNANFLRAGHFSQHRDVYELCDSLGLLVMDEIPAWKTSATFLSSPEGIEMGKTYVRRMVREHGNHTCVALWSLGNEFQSFRSAVAGFVEATAAYVRRIDPGCLVTFAGYFYQFDKAYEHVDVISINEYFGWFLGSLDMLAPMMARVHKQWPDKPILISEFGAAAEAGKRNPDARLAGNLRSVFTKDFSEDHQALYVESHIKEMWFYNQLCKGMVVWAYNDFMEPRGKPRSKDTPPGLNTMGLVTQDRRGKMSWDVVREMYGEIAGEMRKDGGY